MNRLTYNRLKKISGLFFRFMKAQYSNYMSNEGQMQIQLEQPYF